MACWRALSLFAIQWGFARATTAWGTDLGWFSHAPPQPEPHRFTRSGRDLLKGNVSFQSESLRHDAGIGRGYSRRAGSPTSQGPSTWPLVDSSKMGVTQHLLRSSWLP